MGLYGTEWGFMGMCGVVWAVGGLWDCMGYRGFYGAVWDCVGV